MQICITQEAHDLLCVMAGNRCASKSSTLEEMIRDAAKQQKIVLPVRQELEDHEIDPNL